MAKNLRKSQPVEQHVTPQKKSLFERLFGMPISSVNWNKEILAGITALFGTAFVLFAWSAVFKDQFPGPVENIFIIGTIVAMILSNLAQSFWARLPYILVPSIGTLMFMLPMFRLGSNSFAILSVVILLEGIIFLTMSFLPYTKKIISSIPQHVKHSIVLSVGILLIFMGIGISGIFDSASVVGGQMTAEKIKPLFVTGMPSISVKFLLDARTAVMAIGLVVVAYFAWTKNKYTFMLTFIITALVGLLFVSAHQTGFEYQSVTPVIFRDYAQSGFFLPFDSWKPFSIDLVGTFGAISSGLMFFIASFALLLAKDTISTSANLIALGRQSGDMGENDESHHRADKAMQVVGFNRILAGLFGGVPSDIAPESVIAVEADGKTSITPFIFAIGGVVLLVAFNFFKMIPAIAVAPVLVMIGAGMLRGIGKIHWKDPIESIPAIVMMVVAAVTLNVFIAVTLGLAIGMLIRIAIWKFDDAPAGYWILGLLSLGATILFFALN
jgi:AGZA family xanthine/uracil permease-like MFS transporter